MRISPSLVPATAVVRDSNTFRVSDIRLSWYSSIRPKRWISASSTVRLVSNETYISAGVLLAPPAPAPHVSAPRRPIVSPCSHNPPPHDQIFCAGTSNHLAVYRNRAHRTHTVL